MNPVYTGAIASQKKDYRFKIGTIGEKKPEDWIVVEGQHEPLIDRMSFDIVQNKLKSRQRPGQTNEISLFAGLIKCGECGKSLTIRYTNAKHPQQIYPARPTMPLERTTAPSTGLIMTPFTAMCCGKSGNVPELP